MEEEPAGMMSLEIASFQHSDQAHLAFILLFLFDSATSYLWVMIYHVNLGYMYLQNLQEIPQLVSSSVKTLTRETMHDLVMDKHCSRHIDPIS